MGVETSKQIFDGIKSVAWIALVVVGFFAANKLSEIDKKLEKLDSIGERVIRIEYELKLR